MHTCIHTYIVFIYIYIRTIKSLQVHASASPFEALREKMIWLKSEASDDLFGSRLIEAGVSRETIAKWSLDPQINGRSLFDQFEDMEWNCCIEKALSCQATWREREA